MNFQTYSFYYDFLNNDKDYEKETNYLFSLIEKYSIKSVNSILELGSGTANHAKHYAGNYSRVLGLERSDEMVAIANAKNIPNFTSISADITSFRLIEKFDVAFSLFHVISYLNENDDILNCFKSIYDSLNNNGLFIFDIWYTPAVYHLKPETRIKRWESSEILITRIAESFSDNLNNIVEVNYDISVLNKLDNSFHYFKEKHPMRHFSLPEIKFIAEMTGFKVLSAEEFLTGLIPSEKTWGVCFILKKS